MDEAETELPESLFVREGDTFTPTILTTSPWSPRSLHGGPVAAVLAHALEAMPTTVPMFPARFTLELLRPVTLEPLRIETRVVRPGHKVQVVEALLHRVDAPEGEDAVVARAILQLIQIRPLDLPKDAEKVNGPDPNRPPAPENVPRRDGSLPGEGVRFHNTGVEHRAGDGFFMEPGPTQDWIKVLFDLFPGEPLSPFQRVVAAADFGNGVSSILPFNQYAFVNPDLTVYLYRLPVDEWVCLDAVTHVDASDVAGSVGLAESGLYDRIGRIGRSVQSLLIDRFA